MRELYEYYWFNPKLALLRSMEAALIRSLLPKETARPLIDVGTGNGLFARTMGLHFDIGLDREQNQLSRARVQDMHGDLLQFDICSDQVIDSIPKGKTIIVNSVLEHVDDPMRAIANISGMTEANGHVIMTVPSTGSSSGAVDDTLTSDMRTANAHYIENAIAHRNILPDDEWVSLFKMNGFSLVRKEKYLAGETKEYVDATAIFNVNVNHLFSAMDPVLKAAHQKTFAKYNLVRQLPLIRQEVMRVLKGSDTGSCLIADFVKF